MIEPMKVILLQDVAGQGKKGALVDVSDGYARNYLFPRKLAQSATTDALNVYRQQEKNKTEKTERERAFAKGLSSTLSSVTVTLSARAGTGGRLFGSITSKEIADALQQQAKIEIDKHKIVLDEPIRQCGKYPVKVKLGHEQSGIITVVVESQP